MNFLRRLLGKDNDGSIPPHSTEERAMQTALQEAKRLNLEAAKGLSSAADRQVRDAELIGQVIHDLLDRADKRKIHHLNRKVTR